MSVDTRGYVVGMETSSVWTGRPHTFLKGGRSPARDRSPTLAGAGSAPVGRRLAPGNDVVEGSR
jgi:hypothetical protein